MRADEHDARRAGSRRPASSERPIAIVPTASSLPGNMSSRRAGPREDRLPRAVPVLGGEQIAGQHAGDDREAPDPAKPRITSEMANPEACTQAPNSASDGRAALDLEHRGERERRRIPRAGQQARRQLGQQLLQLGEVGVTNPSPGPETGADGAGDGGHGPTAVTRSPGPSRPARAARAVRASLRREGEEHALQRADQQLQAPDRHARVAEREDERVQAASAGAVSARPPRGERWARTPGARRRGPVLVRRRWSPVRRPRPAPGAPAPAAVPSHTTRPSRRNV